MQIRHSIVILFLMSFALPAMSQDTSTGTLDRDTVTAGQEFHLKVRFSQAPSYQAQLRTWFNYRPTNGIPAPPFPIQIQCNGTSQSNDVEADMNCLVPLDEDSGVFASQNSTLEVGPPPGGSRYRYIPFQVPSIQVTSIPDKNVYPTSGTAAIRLDQKQILQNGAAKIDLFLDQLATKVDQHAAETRAFKMYLASVANDARDSLQDTRTQYRAGLQSGKEEPIFFEDFDRQLRVFVIEASAPNTSSNDGIGSGGALFLPVQLSSSETITVRPGPFDGSIGPYLSTLVALLTNIRDAYRKVADTGSDSFTISLRSSPSGAAISYRRIGEQYQDYSRSTDVDQATFPYAMWTFRFKLGKCEVVRFPNPYIETSPNLTVDMQNCTIK